MPHYNHINKILTLIFLFCNEFFVILSVILLPINSPIASAFFFIYLFFFEAVLSVSVADSLAWSRIFWLHLLFTFFLIFLLIFLLIVLYLLNFYIYLYVLYLYWIHYIAILFFSNFFGSMQRIYILFN